MNEIYFAGGCFWGVQKYMSMVKGVTGTKAGYANGKTLNPTYDQVCFMETDHAETVQVCYDKNIVSLETLIDRYFNIIDPTLVDQQGADRGRQYRTGIYYTDEKDKQIIKNKLEALKSLYPGEIIAVECMELKNFFTAEEEHQNFLLKNPQGYCHIGKSAFDELEKLNEL